MGQLRLTASSKQLLETAGRRQARPRPLAPPPSGRFHFLYKAADAALTASLRPERSLAQALRQLFRRRLANYERTAALVQVADGLRPGSARSLTHLLLQPQSLPLAYDELVLLGYGSGSTVFLLRRGEQRLVLKIYRRSLGHSQRGLAEIVAYFSLKYQTVARWYGGALPLVPPATFLMLHSPLLGSTAVGLVQPYISGEKIDLFEDLSAGELLALLRAHPTLCRQFRFFARRTAEIYQREERCLDMVGRQNVMLSKRDDEYRLWVIDNGIFHLHDLKKNEPETYARAMERLAYLESVYEKSLAFSRDIGSR